MGYLKTRIMKITEDQFAGIQQAYFGAIIKWKGGSKELFLNIDNVTSIMLKKEQNVLAISINGAEDLIIETKKCIKVYQDFLKIYQDFKTKFKPDICRATPCNYS